MVSQCDSEGNQYLLLDGISDHKKRENPLIINESTHKSHNGKLNLKPMTKGWKFLVEWKYGIYSWIPLKYLKAYNPVDLDKYSIFHEIEDEPLMKWWVKNTLKSRDRIVSKVK